ncbi:MAG: hypothetical protein M3Y85_01955, partial [Bacteroidota bacterium]|nr:hypothetical protein [Bacteroidota bacterium]
MKSTVLTGILLLLIGAVAHAQLSFLPQIGFEQSHTTLNYGDAFSSGIHDNLKAGLKLDYRFKGGHSPFINLTTSPQPVGFVFNDAAYINNNYQSIKSGLQFRVEAGYQYSSQPIQLKRSSSHFESKAYKTNNEGTERIKRCGSSSDRSRCCQKKMTLKNALANNNLNMRLQPSIAVAYIPSSRENVKATSNGVEYNAANWKTAIVPAMGFEFAKADQRLFTLSVFYTKALGQEKETMTSFSGSKATITPLSSKASTWGMTIGIPFSFAKTT